MKKTLVALASMAALGAFAQSSVTMYGVVEATVDVGYKSSADTRIDAVSAAGVVTTGVTSNATTKAGFRVQDGNDQGVGTSRIGWRGTEDLGGGLSAQFQIEHRFNPDTGTSAATFWQGRSYVQLTSAGTGSLYLGRDYSPAFWPAVKFMKEICLQPP